MAPMMIVTGCGNSSVEAINLADSTAENWALAEERGLGVEERQSAGVWCVVLDANAVTKEELEADPATATYEKIPADSPALARWRIAQVSP